MFMMKSKSVGQPSEVSDGFLQSVGHKICERERFTFSELTCDFKKFHALFCI
jgi:hypothetical protein